MNTIEGGGVWSDAGLKVVLRFVVGFGGKIIQIKIEIQPLAQRLRQGKVDNVQSRRPDRCVLTVETGSVLSAPVRVNDRAGDGAVRNENPPKIAIGTGGQVYVVWANEKERWKGNIRFARSTDGGRTFSRAIDVNSGASLAPVGRAFESMSSTEKDESMSPGSTSATRRAPAAARKSGWRRRTTAAALFRLTGRSFPTCANAAASLLRQMPTATCISAIGRTSDGRNVS